MVNLQELVRDRTYLGYPLRLERIAAQGAAGPVNFSPCPAGCRRVILAAAVYPTLATIPGVWIVLGVRRGGIEYAVISGMYRTSATYPYAMMPQNGNNPIIVLEPGDNFYGRDENAIAGGRLEGSIAYVDVPIAITADTSKATRRG